MALTVILSYLPSSAFHQGSCFQRKMFYRNNNSLFSLGLLLVLTDVPDHPERIQLLLALGSLKFVPFGRGNFVQEMPPQQQSLLVGLIIIADLAGG